MKKVVNPCMCDIGNKKMIRAFAKIEFINEKLSISGVIGPTQNGDASGSCGQCIDEIKSGRPVDGWTEEMLQTFCDLWERWHLNDMRPYCEHQRALGWDSLAKKVVTIYHYCLTAEALKQQKAMQHSSVGECKQMDVFSSEIKVGALPYSMTTYEELSGNLAKYYKPESLLFGGVGGVERKMLGWLYPKEHPDGILGKPCPVCGYKYGSAWKEEAVPAEVIEWLFNLPDTKIQPAWI